MIYTFLTLAIFLAAMGKKTGKKSASMDKAVQTTEEMTDKYKALEKAHSDLQTAHQRSIAFGEMMQSHLRQSNLDTKALKTKLDEWERTGTDISQLKKRLESSESRVRQLEIEKLDLQEKCELYEYSREIVQKKNADIESYKKRLDIQKAAIESYKNRLDKSIEKVTKLALDLGTQQKLLKEEKRCNQTSIQLLNQELVRKEAELNKIRKIDERRSIKKSDAITSTTPRTTLEQCTDTLGLEWGATAGTQATADIPLAVVKGAAAMLQKDIYEAGRKFGRLLPLADVEYHRDMSSDE